MSPKKSIKKKKKWSSPKSTAIQRQWSKKGQKQKISRKNSDVMSQNPRKKNLSQRIK